MYEVDFGKIRIGTKGVGEGAADTRAVAFQKWVCVPLPFFVTTILGTDCETKSAFLLPIEMLSITVYKTFFEQTKP